MAQRRMRGRAINGILLLDKPLGLTSNAALQEVKRLYFAQKAGHTGSLDPLATGMLPICFGEATKLSQYLLEADKHYQVTAKLGIKTTTADSEGEVISERPVNVTLAQIEAVLPAFRGQIQQIPSMFSALKHQGQPLYELARQGIEVEREARTLTIYELSILNFTGDTLSLNVECSKGTYIRNLIEDIGEALGCGAHVIELRRLSAANYSSESMVTLDQLRSLKENNAFEAMDELLLPMESAIEHFPEVILGPTAAFQLQQGNAVQVFQTDAQGNVRIYHRDKLIGIGEMTEDGKLAPTRLLK